MTASPLAHTSASVTLSGRRKSAGYPAAEQIRRGEYLPEIDGLRSLAVAGVLLFHVDVPAFFGGYLGVDVFFVISGFLIISAIRRGVAANSFSLARFYLRRFRRLYPALLCTIALTVLVGAAIQLPRELKQTADAGIAALLSLSNFHFMVAGGYFEGNSQFRALLHTWSLGVEEQFYLIAPIALIGLARFPRLVGPSVFAALVASLGLVIAIVVFGALNISETTAFYMTPTRIWEFAIGGMVGFFNAPVRDRPLVRAFCIAAGLCGILLAYLGLNPFANVSGLDALQPCLSTAILLWAISALASPVRPVLAGSVLTLIGRSSYSIYLVHWPIIVFYKYYMQTSLDLIAQLVLMAASLGLGFLQYQFVEKRFRYPEQSSAQTAEKRRAFWVAASACVFVVLGASAAISMSGGLPSRVRAEQIAEEGASKSPPVQCATLGPGIRQCDVGSRTSTRAIALVGDSHAEYLLPRFAEEASKAGYTTIAYIEFGCPAALGVDTSSSSDHCAAKRQRHIADLNSRTDVEAVVLVSRWNYYESGAAWDRKNNWLLDPNAAWINQSRGAANNHRLLSAGVTRLVDSLRPDITVGLVLPIPQPDFHPGIRAAVAVQSQRVPSMSFARAHHDNETRGFVEILEDVSHHTGRSVQAFDPASLLCRDAHCSAAGGGRLFFRDASHMTDAGAERLQPLFGTAIRKLTGGDAVAQVTRGGDTATDE